MNTSNAFHIPLLIEMGIRPWIHRSSLCDIEKPTWGARLGVILAKPLPLEEKEIYKVFTGMVSVLKLNRNDYWVGSINPREVEWNTAQFVQDVSEWGPECLLMLGRSYIERWDPNFMNYCTSELFSPKLYMTYHPEELTLNPQKKKHAYQDLLGLKETLEGRPLRDT